jgi:TDG/mug DNA glycosylase family protein
MGSLQVCVRPGSLDDSITEEVANDFPAFFAKYTRINRVYFNGSKAETTFRRRALLLLPSTQLRREDHTISTRNCGVCDLAVPRHVTLPLLSQSFQLAGSNRRGCPRR